MQRLLSTLKSILQAINSSDDDASQEVQQKHGSVITMHDKFASAWHVQPGNTNDKFNVDENTLSVCCVMLAVVAVRLGASDDDDNDDDDDGTGTEAD